RTNSFQSVLYKLMFD
ncbi:hypothetical protein CP8484711_0884C, partial [Chlamydia psittaci 84-8471/1]